MTLKDVKCGKPVTVTALNGAGAIGGVGSVLGFVPQMFILFFFLSISEDCGYMARVAFTIDRIFRKFGLSSKSFIPLLISSGYGVPGIMASRTIENEKDRKMTIMVTTFIAMALALRYVMKAHMVEKCVGYSGCNGHCEHCSEAVQEKVHKA